MDAIHACEIGDVEALKHLKRTRSLGDLSEFRNLALRLAVENDHLEVVKWLVKDSGQAICLSDNRNWILSLAARNGNLEMLDWFVTKSGQCTNITDDNHHALQVALLYGHTHTADWIYEHSKSIKSLENPEELLFSIVISGEIQSLLWVFKNPEISIDFQETFDRIEEFENSSEAEKTEACIQLVYSAIRAHDLLGDEWKLQFQNELKSPSRRQL